MLVSLWTEKALSTGPFEPWLRAAHDAQRSPRSTSDLIRLALISYYGGWYLDVDMVPKDDEVLPQRPLIVSDGWSPSGKPNVLCNGAFALPAQHPLLASVRDYAQRALDRGVTDDHFVAGPRAWREAWDALPPTLRAEVDWRLGWLASSQTFIAHMARVGSESPA
jgi:hypothetical protein